MPNNLLIAIGENIKTARKAAKLSQTALAATVKRQQAWLQKVEAGTREARLQDLIDIAAALGVKLADLIPESPEKVILGKKKKNPNRTIDK